MIVDELRYVFANFVVQIPRKMCMYMYIRVRMYNKKKCTYQSRTQDVKQSFN